MRTAFIFLLGFSCGAFALYVTLFLPFRAAVARRDADRREIARIKGGFVVAASVDLAQPAPLLERYVPVYPGNSGRRDDPDPAWLAWLTEVNSGLQYWQDRGRKTKPPRLRDTDVTHPDLGGGPIRPAAYQEVRRLDALPWSATDWVTALAVWPVAAWADRPAYPLWQKWLDWVWEHTWPYERPICRSAMRVNRWLWNGLANTVEAGYVLLRR